MSRLLFFVAMLVLSSNAMAGWEQVGENDDETHYIISSSIKKNGNMAKMWSLTDYKTPHSLDAGVYLSLKKYNEYDCKNNQYRMLSAVAIDGNMGKGHVVLNLSINEDKNISENAFKWKDIIPDSAVEEFSKYACKVKHI